MLWRNVWISNSWECYRKVGFTLYVMCLSLILRNCKHFCQC